MKWTEERTDTLRGMWANNSATVIAGHLGGITRNAVIGKGHRMGLPAKHHASPRVEIVVPTKKTKRRRPAPADRRKSINPEPFATELPQNQSEVACTIAQLTGSDDMTMCRYPLNEPAYDMLYCGAASSGPWCDLHRAIVFKSFGRRA